jgi:hypothetical protein
VDPALVALSLAQRRSCSAPARRAQVAVLGQGRRCPPTPPRWRRSPFTLLSYSCSSLNLDCTGVTITDVIPPKLSRFARREAGGNFLSATYGAATGTAHFVLVDPVPAGPRAGRHLGAVPAGTPVGTQAVNQGTISGSPHRSRQPGGRHGQGRAEWTVTKNVVLPGTPPQVTRLTYKVGITLPPAVRRT